jgi:hypothetical protein
VDLPLPELFKLGLS